MEQLGPAAGELARQDHQGHRGAEDIHAELDDVGPDHGLHPAEEGIDDGDRRHGHDGRLGPPAGEVLEHRRREEEPEAVAERAGHEEEERRRRPGRPAEPILQQLIGGEDLPAEVGRQEDRGDDDPPEQIPEGQLQEPEITAVGHAGDAQERDDARLGRHDRDHHGPGRDVALAQEIALQPLRPRAQPGPQRGAPGDVDGDHGEVDGIHGGP